MKRFARIKPPRPANAGYTMIEVVMAMAVMTVGALGILGMQKASSTGNLEARRMTTAAMVARTWVERLRRDSLMWTVGGSGAASAILNGTQYLSAVPANGDASAWLTPVPAADSEESFAFDHFGNDTKNGTGNEATPEYCVNVRLRWLYPGQAMRADVRVWWHRISRGDSAQVADRRLYADCGVGQEAAISADARVRTLSVSTVLRWNPVN